MEQNIIYTIVYRTKCKFFKKQIMEQNIIYTIEQNANFAQYTIKTVMRVGGNFEFNQIRPII